MKLITKFPKDKEQRNRARKKRAAWVLFGSLAALYFCAVRPPPSNPALEPGALKKMGKNVIPEIEEVLKVRTVSPAQYLFLVARGLLPSFVTKPVYWNICLKQEQKVQGIGLMMSMGCDSAPLIPGAVGFLQGYLHDFTLDNLIPHKIRSYGEWPFERMQRPPHLEVFAFFEKVRCQEMMNQLIDVLRKEGAPGWNYAADSLRHYGLQASNAAPYLFKHTNRAAETLAAVAPTYPSFAEWLMQSLESSSSFETRSRFLDLIAKAHVLPKDGATRLLKFAANPEAPAQWREKTLSTLVRFADTDAEVASLLEPFLADKNPVIRLVAAQGLIKAKTRFDATVSTLLELLKADGPPSFDLGAEFNLARYGWAGNRFAQPAFALSPPPAAAFLLGELGDKGKGALPQLNDLIRSGSTVDRFYATGAIAKITADYGPYVRTLLDNSKSDGDPNQEPAHDVACIYLLSQCGETARQALPEILALRETQRADVRAAVDYVVSKLSR